VRYALGLSTAPASASPTQHNAPAKAPVQTNTLASGTPKPSPRGATIGKGSVTPKGTVTPNDHVQCNVFPDAPFQFGNGGTIYGSASFQCLPHAPTLSSAVMKLWRRNPSGTYTLVAQKTSTELAEYWDVEAAYGCSGTGGIEFNQYHTNAILTVFYGNWAGPYSVISSAKGFGVELRQPSSHTVD
jgi:hypothetical protein